MTFEIIIFLGACAMSPKTVRELDAQGFSPVPTLVRYADEDMLSPSCSDWIVPGTIES